jgi:hypothetical protein
MNRTCKKRKDCHVRNKEEFGEIKKYGGVEKFKFFILLTILGAFGETYRGLGNVQKGVSSKAAGTLARGAYS